MKVFKSLLTSIAIAIILLALWNYLDKPAPRPATPLAQTPDPAMIARIDALEDALYSAQQNYQQLEQRLNRLEQQAEPSHDDAAEQPQALTQQPAARPEHRRVLKRPADLQQRLLDAGLPADTVQRIHNRISENRLALLELRNRAIREDWIDTPQYLEQMQALSNPAEGIHEQEGDDVYDQYLYAAGRPNRVTVTEVYTGSAAEQAGIQPQDVILSYAQQRLFDMRSLQRATTEGVDGEMVLVELLRDGERITTSVPRGPLGIAMTVTRTRPE